MQIRPLISSSSLSHLDCVRCHRRETADDLQTVCPACGGPLFARYELSRLDLRGLPWDLPHRSNDLWRYAELLPIRTKRRRVGFGEGMTPMLRAARLEREIGIEELWVKDEGLNPTGSFKSRGMAIAVARAAELKVPALATPSAGNAGLAMAAYSARNGLRALVAFPEDIPEAYVRDCRDYGAEVLVAGRTIREAGQALKKHVETHSKWHDAFDLSTLREPYRLEGKKTMGYEIAEQLGDAHPDVVVYPTGGGTGLIGIAKAYEEMAALGWIEEGRQPRMIAIQMSGCCPIVHAHSEGSDRAVPREDADTRCWGLRVPAPFADREILTAIRKTRGTAIAVAEDALDPTFARVMRMEGIDMAPEGCAAIAALPELLKQGALQPDERVVVLNTASSRMYK